MRCSGPHSDLPGAKKARALGLQLPPGRELQDSLLTVIALNTQAQVDGIHLPVQGQVYTLVKPFRTRGTSQFPAEFHCAGCRTYSQAKEDKKTPRMYKRTLSFGHLPWARSDNIIT